jgi:hypothetical protein
MVASSSIIIIIIIINSTQATQHASDTQARQRIQQLKKKHLQPKGTRGSIFPADKVVTFLHLEGGARY